MCRTTDARHYQRRLTPEPTPVEKRIVEVWQAHRDGELTLSHARVGEIKLSQLVPFKNGDFGIRNQSGNVLTEAMIAEIYLTKFGKAVSQRTIRAARKRLALRFDWFGWCATPAGYTYRMRPDGAMIKTGKRGKMVGEILCRLERYLPRRIPSVRRKEPAVVVMETGLTGWNRPDRCLTRLR